MTTRDIVDRAIVNPHRQRSPRRLRALPSFATILVCASISSCGLFDLAPVVTVKVPQGPIYPGAPVELAATVVDDHPENLIFLWTVNGEAKRNFVSTYAFVPPSDGNFAIACIANDGYNLSSAEIEVQVSSPGTTSYLNTKRLLGLWHFYFSTGTDFILTYDFDEMRDLTATGDEWKVLSASPSGTKVEAVGGFQTPQGRWSVYDPFDGNISILYSFDFDSDTRISGYCQILDSQLQASDRYTLIGAKLKSFP